MASKKQPETVGAFGADKLYGNRMDQTFDAGERFLLVAAKVLENPIPTDIGDARKTEMLVAKLDTEGHPIGGAFKVGTLSSAIADKIDQLVTGELPAVVFWTKVRSKQFKTDATVLQYVGSPGVGNAEAEEFGINAADLGRLLDTARTPSESMGF